MPGGLPGGGGGGGMGGFGIDWRITVISIKFLLENIGWKYFRINNNNYNESIIYKR